MLSSLIIALTLLLPAADMTVNQTIICECESMVCPPRPHPPYLPDEPLSAQVFLKAVPVKPEPVWFNLREYARLINFGTPGTWGVYLTSYYRTRLYTLATDDATLSYLGNPIGGAIAGLYSYCLERDAPYRGETCTVIRSVNARVRVLHPHSHWFDRDANGKIDKLDARHFIRCWHALDEPDDWCEGEFGIPVEVEAEPEEDYTIG